MLLAAEICGVGRGSAAGRVLEIVAGLFVAQCFDGLDLHGCAGGDEGGRESDDGEEKRDCEVGRGVVRLEAEEKAL